MRRKAFIFLLGFLPLVSTGCTGAISAEEELPLLSVTGSVSMVPTFEGAQEEDGEACVGSLDSGRTLDGSKVVLRDATGAVVGLSSLEGYSGEVTEETEGLLGQGIYRSADGLCHWDFTIEDVDSATQFLQVEVVGVPAEGLVYDRQELQTEEVSVFLGGESIEQETARLEGEAELLKAIRCAGNPDGFGCDD